ncbi:exonuclease SbcCD subunit D [Candidatus Dependentiae bacterium]|nr:exonuclease SbcCD subunit D [Candidatus Dependentiae bacterium]
MIKFIHTADIHFGMENYGKIDPATGIHTRLLDFEKALNFCIDFAVDNQVDFFLFSGDAYKTAHPSPTQQHLLLQCFLRLYKAQIPIIIIVGNHDNPLSFGKANSLEIFGQLPVSGFHVISKPTTLLIETKSGPVQIVGIPWPTRNNITTASTNLVSSAIEITDLISKSLSRIIKQMAEQLDQNIPSVLAGHLTVTSGIFSGSEKKAIYGTDPVFLPSELAIEPFDYVALGHLHRYQNLNAKGYPAVVYSGSIERIDFGERKEEKGFCFVKIHEKNNTEHEFIKTPTRPFIQIELELSDDIDQTEQILNELKKHEVKDSVIKIIYTLNQGQKDKVDIPAIQQACADAMYIAGIVPIRKNIIRDRRTPLKVDMDLIKLLDSYLSNRQELKSKKDSLLAKAVDLENQCECDN